MAVQRGKLTGTATPGTRKGETRVAGRGWTECAAKDGVFASFCGEYGNRRDRPRDRPQRGYRQGTSLPRSGESARRGEGEKMSFDDRFSREPGEGNDRKAQRGGLGGHDCTLADPE